MAAMIDLCRIGCGRVFFRRRIIKGYVRNSQNYYETTELFLMETIIKFLDTVEDSMIAAVYRLRRLLSRRPKERRQVARTDSTSPQRRQADATS